jgi:hypothetical protein
LLTGFFNMVVAAGNSSGRDKIFQPFEITLMVLFK